MITCSAHAACGAFVENHHLMSFVDDVDLLAWSYPMHLLWSQNLVLEAHAFEQEHGTN
jgi:hypothetical protein